MIETPFNYTGAKYKLLTQLLPRLDYTKPYFVDLFCGGGSVYTNVVDQYQMLLINDIIPELMTIHQALARDNRIIELVQQKVVAKDDAEGYAALRASFNRTRNAEELWALMLCCTNNMMRFNQKFEFNQTFGKRTWNPNTARKVEAFVQHIRPFAAKLLFISRHFSEVKLNEPSMVYIDPPYSNTEAGYNAYWKKDDDLKLYQYCVALDQSGSSFMVSGVLTHDGVSCVLLDKLVAQGYKLQPLVGDYNKVSRKGAKETTEVIITNYEVLSPSA